MSDQTITSSIAPLLPLSELEPLWRTLEVSANGSFFTSWNFIGPLLKKTRCPPDLFMARRGQHIIALALIAAKDRKTPLGTIKGLTLNQTGARDEDVVYIELNDILCHDGDKQEILRALAHTLQTSAPARAATRAATQADWQELHLCGIGQRQLGPIADAIALTPAPPKVTPAPYVDLSAVRASGYLPLLSRNTRARINKAMRLFEASHGPLALDIITDRNDILASLETLAALQISHFKDRPAPSSFGNPFFCKFVEAMALEPDGPISGTRIMRIKAGETLLGLLVNVHHRGVIANYQAAFTPFASDNKLKPGLVSHTLAIEHHGAAGDAVYHFLGGDQQYKKSLATDTDHVMWTRLQKPHWRIRLETRARSVKTRLTNKAAQT